MPAALDEVIDSLGFGKFSCFMIFAIGLLFMGDSSETNLVALISPQLRCAWNLTSLETSFLSSTVFLGLGSGAICLGYLADKYGRKKITILSAIFVLSFGLLCSAVTNFTWLSILRFFVGFGVGAVGTSLCLLAEFIPTRHRGKSAISQGFFYGLGNIYIAVVGLLLMQTAGWKVFLVMAAFPSAVFLLISPWLPESLHYLQNTENYDAVTKTLKRISSLHNTDIPTTKISHVISPERGNMRILFSKEYRWKMLIVTVLFVSTFIGYFGIVLIYTEYMQVEGFLHTHNMTSNDTQCYELQTEDYVQNIVVAVAEIPGIFLPLLIVDRIGRKSYLFPGFIVCGVCFLCLNIDLSRTLVTGLVFIMRLLLAGLVEVPYLLCAELFPTVVRASAIGIASGTTKFSLIAVPFIVQSLMHISLLATTLIFSGLCFFSAVLVLLLPETKDVSLSEQPFHGYAALRP